MTPIEARCLIAAEPAAVWAILTGPAGLVAGGLGITRFEGQIATGQKIRPPG